jgi:hypothetical protein
MDDTTRHISLSHSRRQKYKNNRHLQTDTDQLAHSLVRQVCAADQLENPDTWGTGKNDHAPGGKPALITKDGRCAARK